MTSPPIGTDEELIERLRREKIVHINEDGYKYLEPVNPDGPEAADALQSRISEVERLNNLLSAGTLSLTSFDGHCVRIDFSSREEAEQLFDALFQHDGIGPGIAHNPNEG